jgi:hypothetical protein
VTTPTTVPRPTTGPGSFPPRPTLQGPGRALDALRGVFRGSVGQLRLIGTVCVLASLVFGVLGASAFRDRASALSDARADTAQLVRVQTIQTSLVQADAQATNGFLVAGLEPAGQRAIYDQAIASVAALISGAARAQPDDAPALGRVNANLSSYTELIAVARSNNRQGFPVGSAYLRQASDILRAQILPELAQLTEANRLRTSAAFDSSGAAGTWLGIAIGIGLVGLLAGAALLAMRTHRIINVPIAAAVAAVLLVVLVGGLFMSLAQAKARHVRSTSYTATYALARARVLAYDAKSEESLTLIARGSGQANELLSKSDLTQANTWFDVASKAGAGTSATNTQLSQWIEVHKVIRQADDTGHWDTAVATATRSGRHDSNPNFGAFAATSANALNAQAKAANNGLTTWHGPLVGSGWATLLLGLVAAVASWWGVAQRLEEYR